jgi:hypothetical protein
MSETQCHKQSPSHHHKWVVENMVAAPVDLRRFKFEFDHFSICNLHLFGSHEKRQLPAFLLLVQ